MVSRSRGQSMRAGGGGDTQRQRAFIADRKLHQHMRQLGIGQLGALQLAALLRNTRTQASPASWTDSMQTADQDEAEGKLKELRKTVHGDRSGPHKARFCGPANRPFRPVLDLCPAKRHRTARTSTAGRSLARGCSAK